MGVVSGGGCGGVVERKEKNLFPLFYLSFLFFCGHSSPPTGRRTVSKSLSNLIFYTVSPPFLTPSTRIHFKYVLLRFYFTLASHAFFLPSAECQVMRVFRRALALKYQSHRATALVFRRAKEAHQKRIDDGELPSNTPALTAAALLKNGEAEGARPGVSFHGNKHAPGFFDKTTDDVYLMFLEAKAQRQVTNILDTDSS